MQNISGFIAELTEEGEKPLRKMGILPCGPFRLIGVSWGRIMGPDDIGAFGDRDEVK